MLTRTERTTPVEDLSIAEAPSFDLNSLFDVARRLWVYAAFGSAVCLCLAIAYLATATPRFTATTSILLDTQSSEFLQKQNIMADPTVDTGVVDSQVEVLNSDSIALAVIRKLNLAADSEFVGPPKGMLGWIVATGGKLTAKAKTLLGLPVADESSADTPERKAADVFAKRLTAKRVGITYVIDIAFDSESAVKSADIANAIAQAYIDEELNATYASTNRASTWLQGRLHDIRVLAADADKAVQTYKLQNGIVDTGKGLMTQQQIADLNSQLIVAKTSTAEAKARLDRIGHMSGNDVLDATVTDALSNAVITRLRAQYLDLQSRHADLSARLGSKHETVTKVGDQMQEIKRAIANEVQRIADAYASDYAIAKAREASLEASLKALVGEAGTSDLAQVRLRDLQSSAEGYRQLYDNFLQKAQEATQQQTSPMTATRIITAATVPLRKSSPKTALVLAAAFMLGAAAGGGIGFLRDVRAVTFSTPEDVRSVTGLPCLGTLPELVMRRSSNVSISEYVLGSPFSRYSETLRNVKMAIDGSNRPQTNKVVAITSAVPEEGKTTVAANLASLVASYGLKTLIIDCDLHNRGLSATLAPDAKVGLMEALADPARLSDLITTRQRSGLHVLPCVLQGRPNNSSEVLASSRMQDLLAAARLAYEFVFIDLPPIAPLVDGKAAAQLVDDVVLVVRWEKSSRSLVSESLAVADSIRDRLVGLVLSRADPVALRRMDKRRSKKFDAYYVG